MSGWLKLFLTFVMGTVFALAVNALFLVFSTKPTIPEVSAEPRLAFFNFDSIELLNEKGQKLYMTKSPITNAHFAFFCDKTGYQTQKERLQQTPNWKTAHTKNGDEARVIHLDLKDIHTYLRWLEYELKEIHSANLDHLGQGHALAFFRLPSIKELEQVQKKGLIHSKNWEWTSSTLREVDPSLPNADDYLGFWGTFTEDKLNTTYLRERDLPLQNLHEIGFRILWSSTPLG